MTGAIGFQGSIQPDNGYSFHCPTVGRDARLIVCAYMRTRHYRGENFAAQDCKLAMNACKCPAVRMIEAEYRTGERRFYDREVKLHRLPAEIAEAIDRVIVVPGQAAGLDLTDEQKKRLFGNEKTAVPGIMSPAPSPAKPRRVAKAGKPADKLAGARESTDLTDGLGEADVEMSSLVNKALHAHNPE